MRVDLVADRRPLAKCWRAAVDEYAKRLSGFCVLRMASAADPRATPLVIAPDGARLASEEFAARIEAIRGSGRPDIAIFLDGDGPAGAERIALSRMDMDPGLRAALVAEQVYRAYRILTGQPYHK